MDLACLLALLRRRRLPGPWRTYLDRELHKGAARGWWALPPGHTDCFLRLDVRDIPAGSGRADDARLAMLSGAERGRR